MRDALLAMALVVVASSAPAEWLGPGQPEIYRGPAVSGKPAMVVVPSRGMPLEFGAATFSRTPESLAPADAPITTLRTTVRSLSVRTIPVSSVTLRVAIGPTSNGMMTFRMRARAANNPAPSILPNRSPVPVQFVIDAAEPQPGIIAMSAQMRIVFTVERIEDAGVLFENPDATELLWEALGRPPLRSQ